MSKYGYGKTGNAMQRERFLKRQKQASTGHGKKDKSVLISERKCGKVGCGRL